MKKEHDMQVFEFGDSPSDTLLIQPVGGHEISMIENEAALIRQLSGQAFHMIAVRVDNWNRDLSPWHSPAVFGSEGFGDGAADTLGKILPLLGGYRKRIIGGYSLAGLFALWAGYQTELFDGIAAASPSVWFPGFTDYMARQPIRTSCVCLSLGNREEKTRNPVMSRVGDCIREAQDILVRQGISCCLAWNEGNHFREPDLRTAKAFAWVMAHII